MAVVIIPLEFQVDPSRASAWEEAYGIRTTPDAESPSTEMARFCASHRIPVLDLIPELAKAATSGAHPYFRYDPHWTRDGHRVAARAIVEFLRRESLLPTERG